MASRSPLQFSLYTLLTITTVFAVAAGVVAALDIPYSSPVVQGFLGAYLFVVGVWSLVRGPTVFRELAAVSRRRRELRAERQALMRELENRQQSRPRAGGNDRPHP